MRGKDGAELLNERRDRVMLLTLSNPAARNALGPAVYEAGIAAMAEAAEDDGVGAVVLTGAGGHFCGGGNLGRLQGNREKPPAVQRQSIERLHGFVRGMRACPKPVIAAVEGAAAGAGFSLALACDLIVAASNARFVMAYVKVGLNPDGGASALLGRALAPQLCSELLFDGEAIAAERLHGLGVVNRLCEPGGALAEALRWGARLADGPTVAIGRAKRLIESAHRAGLDEQLDREADWMTEAVYHAEAGEGIEAFFAKRPPRYHD